MNIQIIGALVYINKDGFVMRLLIIAIWAVLALYIANSLGVPKNIYYALTVYPIVIGGAMVIYYLFRKKGKEK